MENKVELYGKLFTSMLSDKILYVAKMDEKTLECEDPWNWFGIEFKTKKLKDEFWKLVEDVDQNQKIGAFAETNIIKMTFENVFDDKWRAKMAKEEKQKIKKRQEELDKYNTERWLLEIEDLKDKVKQKKEGIRSLEEDIEWREKEIKKNRK